MKVTTINYEM